MKYFLVMIIRKKREKVKNILKFNLVLNDEIDSILKANSFTIELYEEKEIMKIIMILNNMYNAILEEIKK